MSHTRLPTHSSNSCRRLKRIQTTYLQGQAARSYRRWECSPCGPMTRLGSAHTHNSKESSPPPPEEIAADTPGPGRSLVTQIP